MKYLKGSAVLFSFSALLLVISCAKGPDSEEPMIVEVEKPLQLSDTTDVYIFDTLTSFIEWVGTKPTGRHNGIIRIKEGKAYLYEDTVVAVTVTIDLTTIDVLDLQDSPALHKELLAHLKSEDFLNIHTFPTAYFELTDIYVSEQDTKSREDNLLTILEPNFIIKGYLTIRDKTVEITFPARIDVRNKKLEVSAKFNIDRTDWGITYQYEYDPVSRSNKSYIQDTVNVGFTVIAREKQKILY